MLKQAEAASYADVLNAAKSSRAGAKALSQISPGEIGYGIVGAGAGGALAYLASKLFDRKASTKRRLLYALLGATGGAGASQLILREMQGPEGFTGSKLDELRLAKITPTPPTAGSSEAFPVAVVGDLTKTEPSNLHKAYKSKLALGGAVLGGIGGTIHGGYRGYGAAQKGSSAITRDFSGWHAAQRAFNDFVRIHPNVTPEKWPRIREAILKNRSGKFSPDLMRAAETKIIEQTYTGPQVSHTGEIKQTYSPSKLVLDNSTKITSSAVNVLANAAIQGTGGALLGYSLGTLADYAGRRWGTPEIAENPFFTKGNLKTYFKNLK